MTGQTRYATLPAGTYVVGDPCYSMGDHENWMDWLERADYMNQPLVLLARTPNGTAVGISTASGDGTYRGSDGNDYPVDAGMIGVVPLVDAYNIENVTGRLGHIVTFDHDFTMERDEDGVIHIGGLEIPTGGGYDDEEEVD